jgi:hypothetical protein
MYQCKLVQESNNGIVVLTAWIEDKAAFRDAIVELKGEKGLWKVREVYPGKFSSEWVNENCKKAYKGTRAFSDI